MKKIFTLSLLFCMLTNIHAADIYVTQSGGASPQDGSSWATAKAGGNQAVGVASPLATIISGATSGTNIHVAAGTYYLGGSSTDRTSYFPIKKGVKVYGGYHPTTFVRDWQAAGNQTILSGDVQRNDVAGRPTSTTQSDRTDNVYHVISEGFTTAYDDISGGLYDGFYVEGGNASAAESALHSRGGGVYMYNIANFGTEDILRNIIIRYCSATTGGGFALYQASSTSTTEEETFKATNFTIDNCTSTNDCGGFFIWYGKTRLTNTVITNNTAGRHGGGMYNTSSKVDARYIKVDFNNAGGSGGGTYNTSSYALFYFTNGSISYNTAATYGGGMVNTTGRVELRNMELVGNTANGTAAAQGGGAIYNTTITNSAFGMY